MAPSLGLGLGINKLKVRSWTPQYKAVYDAMPTKPSSVDAQIQQWLMNEVVDRGYYAKAQIIDIFCTHSADSSLINWKSPGTFNPSAVNGPAWEQYKGYTGNPTGTKYLRSNYIPFSDAVNITKSNIAVAIGIGTDVLDNGGRDYGVYDGNTTMALYTRWLDFMNPTFNNDSSLDYANTNSIGHYVISRNLTASFSFYKNMAKVADPAGNNAAETLLTKEIYICGRNNNGTPEPNKKQVSYFILCEYLTETEAYDLVRIMETYLSYYSAGYISEKIAVARAIDKTLLDLTTYIPDDPGTIHPSVVDTGINFNGYRYWMANTPWPTTTYAGSESAYENPSIWCSNDGNTWVVPAGLTNPIYPKPVSFNSDNDLYYENNKLYCIFNSIEDLSAGKLISLESSDGVAWGNKTYIGFPAALENRILSPSVIKIEGDYYIYFVKVIGVGPYTYQISRIKCSTLLGTYGDEEAITITVPASRSAWHMDIVEIDGVYWISCTTLSFIFLAYSSDGLTFSNVVPEKLIVGTNPLFDTNGVYRPSLSRIGDKYRVYYAGIKDIYKTGYVEVRFD